MVFNGQNDGVFRLWFLLAIGGFATLSHGCVVVELASDDTTVHLYGITIKKSSWKSPDGYHSFCGCLCGEIELVGHDGVRTVKYGALK